MAIQIFSKKQQAKGQFNMGEIMENKPLGFPHERGSVKSFSNLFYWAHAWTPGKKSLIGEHPHQGFEILSYVLHGSIEHYDSQQNEWQELREGDLQIIRAGSGIRHAEMVNEKSAFFQIWFDPNLQTTLKKPASYDNYQASLFPTEINVLFTVKHLTGEGSPLEMDSAGIHMSELIFNPGTINLPTEPGKKRAGYVIEGSIDLMGNGLGKDTFFIMDDSIEFSFIAHSQGRIFLMDLDDKVDYPTYADMQRH